MYSLGIQIAQLYLSPNDRLIGVIGEAGSGKSALIRGMFPGLELTNDDNGVYVRPLPLLEQDRGFAFFAPHTYHVDIRFENGFTQMNVLADAIIEACEKNGVILSSVFQTRYVKNVALIKEAIDAGRFGKIVLASTQCKWFRTQEYYDSATWRGTWALDGGGALMNQSIHTIDLLIYLNGDVEEVSAFAGTLSHTGIEVEDNAVAILKFKNGALGTIEGSTSCAPGYPRRF